MPEMNFQNQNEFRSYPFVEGTTQELANHWLVSAGISVRSDPATDNVQEVYLSSITLDTDIIFTVSCDGTAVLSFVVPAAATFGTTVFSSSPSYEDEGTDTRYTDDCYTNNWFGYITVGRLDDLLTTLAGGDIFFSEIPVFEASVVSRFGGGSVMSLNIANKDREKVILPSDCDQLTWNIRRGYWVMDTCLKNDIVFSEGFNFAVAVNESTKTVRFIPKAGGGKGYPCEPIELHLDDEPAVEGGTLDGDVRCGETLSRINTATGSAIAVVAGDGVVIASDPLTSTITVSLRRASAGTTYTEFV